MNNKIWTLNADVGEGCDDALIMPFINCANICSGQHAGSVAITKKTVGLAEQYGVTIGAHPGYPDRENFGRFSLDLSPEALRHTLHEQIDVLKSTSQTLAYVKPHGALNHDMLASNAIFETICEVIARISKALVIMVPTNARQTEQLAIAEKYDLTIWWEVFADRAYEPSGLLRPRKFEDAVHKDSQVIVSQIQRIREYGEIVAINGSVLDVSTANTICIHGDNSASVVAIRQLAGDEFE